MYLFYLLSVCFSFGLSLGQRLLHSQLNSSGITLQTGLWNTGARYVWFSADDFIVPNGRTTTKYLITKDEIWEISTITFKGNIGCRNTSFQNLWNIDIFTQLNGQVFFTNTTTSTTGNINPTIDLGNKLNLTSGKYWISIYPIITSPYKRECWLTLGRNTTLGYFGEPVARRIGIYNDSSLFTSLTDGELQFEIYGNPSASTAFSTLINADFNNGFPTSVINNPQWASIQSGRQEFSQKINDYIISTASIGQTNIDLAQIVLPTSYRKIFLEVQYLGFINIMVLDPMNPPVSKTTTLYSPYWRTEITDVTEFAGKYVTFSIRTTSQLSINKIKLLYHSLDDMCSENINSESSTAGAIALSWDPVSSIHRYKVLLNDDDIYDTGFLTNLTIDLSTPGTYSIRVIPYIDIARNLSLCKPFLLNITDSDVISKFPYMQNFNEDMGDWRGTGNQSSWEYGTPNKLYIKDEETKAWVSGGVGKTTYNRDEDSYLLSPLFDFTKKLGDAKVTLSLWTSFEKTRDFAVVQVCYDTCNDTKTVYGDQSNLWYQARDSGWSTDSEDWFVATTTIKGSQGRKFRLRISVQHKETLLSTDGIAIKEVKVEVDQTKIYIGVGTVGGILFLAILGVSIKLKSKRNKRRKEMRLSEIELDSTFDIPKSLVLSNIVVQEKIGSGAFGDVFRGELTLENDIKVPVALKRWKLEDAKAMKNECKVMETLNPYAIKLYGIHNSGSDWYLVLEYANKGSLLNLLHSKRDQLSLTDQINLCIGACKGCCFLSFMGVIHRDVAARNFLIVKDARDYKVKISDFGSSRRTETYSPKSDFMIPVKWSAPEVLRQQPQTTQSDVIWSCIMGSDDIRTGTVASVVTIQAPFAEYSNKDTVQAVLKGERLFMPPNCPPMLYNLMKSEKPNQRPSFSEILTELEKIKESMERMSLDNSANNSMEIYNEVDEQKNYVLRVEPVTYSNNYN